MKIREIYTVVREYTPRKGSYDVKGHCLHVLDEAGEFLYGGGRDDEISVRFQIDKGNGWEDFNPENK